MEFKEEWERESFSLFISVANIRYLEKKPAKKFSSLAESDMIQDLLCDTWFDIKSSYDLHQLALSQLINFFKNYPIIFPR